MTLYFRNLKVGYVHVELHVMYRHHLHSSELFNYKNENRVKH